MLPHAGIPNYDSAKIYIRKLEAFPVSHLYVPRVTSQACDYAKPEKDFVILLP